MFALGHISGIITILLNFTYLDIKYPVLLNMKISFINQSIEGTKEPSSTAEKQYIPTLNSSVLNSLLTRGSCKLRCLARP